MRRYKENIDYDDLQPITVLTLKLSTAAVLARAISQTQKSIERVRSGASRTKSRLQHEHHSHQFSLQFLPHSARFSHHFLTCSYHCHRASSSQTITEAAAGFCMYVLPCAAGRPGRRRRTRTAEGRTNSPFTPSLTCVLARDTPPPPRRRTSRRRPGFLNLLEVDRNDRLSRHL